jgi:hypothetical protein
MMAMKIKLNEQSSRVRIGIIWLRIETGCELSEHRNEPSGSIKFEEFPDY